MLAFGRAILRMSRGRLDGFLIKASAAAFALAVLEAMGLALIVPLVQALQGAEVSLPWGEEWFRRTAGSSEPLSLAKPIGAVAFVLFLLKGILAIIYLRWSIKVVLQEEAVVAGDLLESYLQRPYRDHLAASTSMRQATVNDLLHRVYADGFIGLITATADTAVMALILAVLLLVEPIVTACAVAYLVVVGIGYQRLTHGRAARAGEALSAMLSRSHRVVADALGSYKTIRLGGNEAFFSRYLRATKFEAADQHGALMMIYRLPRYFLEIALLIGVALLAIGLFSSLGTAQATAALGLFLTAAFRLLPSLNRVLAAASSARALRHVVDDIAEDLFRDEGCGARPAKLETDAMSLQLRHVEFRFRSDGPLVLRDISFDIHGGDFVGIVGGSGAGKSTLLDLILGLLEPTAGEVLLDGQPLARVTEHWQRRVGYVPQQTVLIEDSLRRNVAFGVPDSEIDDDAVLESLELTALRKLPAELADGLDTVLIEAGAHLSGGQRQRLGIARALYRKPSMLVLDEPTASLDISTESQIMSTVAHLAKDRTVLMVTHRLDTIANCDRVIALDSGQITWVGSPSGGMRLIRSLMGGHTQDRSRRMRRSE